MAKNINRKAVTSMKGETVDFSQFEVAPSGGTQDINSRQEEADKKKTAVITIRPPKKGDPAAPAIAEKIAEQKEKIRAARKTTTKKAPVAEATEADETDDKSAE